MVVSMVLFSCTSIDSIVKKEVISNKDPILCYKSIRHTSRDAFMRVLILYPYLRHDIQDMADGCNTIIDLDVHEYADFIMNCFNGIGGYLLMHLDDSDKRVFINDINNVTLQLPLNTDGTVDGTTLEGFGAFIQGIYDALEYISHWQDYKCYIEKGAKV